MRVLITRAEKEGRATAARLEALGHTALVEPLTTIVAVEAPDLPPVADLQAVTATSLNAVEVLAGRTEVEPLLALPFFAVGGRTAEAARAVGFSDVRSADGDRRDLVKAITAALDPAAGAILWLVGRDRAGDLVADLAPAGFTVRPVEVYRAEPVAALSETARAAIAAGEIDAALVFSPRSGAILLERLAECGFSPGSLDFPVHAISEATARPFREAGWREVVVAASPDSDAMSATLPSPPPAADGDQIRSSAMPPKSRKDARSLPTTEAVIAAADAADAADVAETATETTVAANDRAEEAAFAARVEAAEKAAAAMRGEPPLAAVAPPPPAPVVVRRGLGLGGILVATLLGGAAGVGGSYGLALQGLLPQGGDGGRVAALEAAVTALRTQKPATDPAAAERLTALETRVRTLAAPAIDTATVERLGALEQHVRQMGANPAPAATAGADAATAERLTALEQRVAGLATPAAPVAQAAPAAPVDLTAVEARLARLEAAKPAAPDLTAVEGRIARLEATAKPAPVDLGGIEERIARLEGVPAVRLPVDLADRVAGLEAAAKARAEAAGASVAGALSSIAAEGASKQALAEMAGQVDRALGSLRENAGAEIAALKARLERLGGGIDAESRAMVERAGADAKALAARLGIETQAIADRLAAQTASTVEDLRRRNDDLARSLTERMTALVAASDVEGRKRIEDVARGFAEKTTALSAAVESELKARGEETAEALKRLRGDLDATLGRVGMLETATREVGSSGQKMVEKVGEAAAAAESKVGVLENRLAGIEAEAEAARRARGEAVVVIALSDLKSAVEAGRPFATELGAVEAAARGGIDMAELKPFADKGVPTAAALRAGWAKVTRAATAAAEAQESGTGVFDRLRAHATGMVKVRQPGEATGDDIAALAARVDARLAAGDLAGALAAWRTLPEASRKASADWGTTLFARVAVDTALAARIAAVTARLAQPK